IDLFTKNSEFFTYYKNNFIVAGCSSVLVCLIALFAGYALSRIKIKWNKWVIATLIFSQMFPIVSRLISLYSILRTIGLLNTHLGLILAITAAQIPFSITLMASFFDGVPKSLEEAAYVDGAGRVRTLFQVVTPLVVPGLLAVGIYSFLMTWDDFLHASTLIQSDALRTLSIGINLRYLGETSYDWSLVNTISVVGTLPMVFVFFFFQKYMVKGLTAGAVKG
ncbi:MAG: carbohydrate ABC transporter permease, partial [Clostridia bacterium]